MIKPTTTVLFPETPFISRESIQLGRIVQNPHHPHQDYLQVFTIPSDPSNVLTTTQTDFQTFLSKNKSSKLRSQLGAMILRLNLSSAHSHSREEGFSSLRTTTYLLNNNGEWFRRMIRERQTRIWIEQAIEYGATKLYYIVGFRTVRDLRYCTAATREATTGGGIVGNPGTLTGFGSNQAEVDGTILSSRTSAGSLSFMVPGEVIYGVQYRKLEFKWFSSKHNLKPNDVILEKGNRWKTSVSDVRGEENNEGDILEINMEGDSAEVDEAMKGFECIPDGDSADVQDFTTDENGIWEKFDTEDGEEFFVYEEIPKADDSEEEEEEDEDE